MTKAAAFFIAALAACAFLMPSQTNAASEDDQAITKESGGLHREQVRHDLEDRFSMNANGIIRDTKTGLEWFVGPDRDTNWDEAKSWVETLTLDGGGWRMPTREELKNIYEKGAEGRNLSSVFNTSVGFVWTGETVGSSHAWGFCFDIGGDYWPRLTFSETARAFAVRTGK